MKYIDYAFIIKYVTVMEICNSSMGYLDCYGNILIFYDQEGDML